MACLAIPCSSSSLAYSKNMFLANCSVINCHGMSRHPMLLLQLGVQQEYVLGELLCHKLPWHVSPSHAPPPAWRTARICSWRTAPGTHPAIVQRGPLSSPTCFPHIWQGTLRGTCSRCLKHSAT